MQEERDQRTAFADLLGELHALTPPLVNAKTAWKDLEEMPKASEDARMVKILADQPKGRAMNVFDDFVDDLSKKYQAVRVPLKDAYKAATALDVLTCGEEGFDKAIREHKEASELSQGHIRLFYSELLKLAQEEEAKKERRKQRDRKEFCRLVRKYIERGKLEQTATFEEAAVACKERSAWKDVPEEERASLYVEAIREAIERLKEDAAKKGDREKSKSGSRKRERSASRGRGDDKKARVDHGGAEDGEIEEGEA